MLCRPQLSTTYHEIPTTIDYSLVTSRPYIQATRLSLDHIYTEPPSSQHVSKKAVCPYKTLHRTSHNSPITYKSTSKLQPSMCNMQCPRSNVHSPIPHQRKYNYATLKTTPPAASSPNKLLPLGKPLPTPAFAPAPGPHWALAALCALVAALLVCLGDLSVPGHVALLCLLRLGEGRHGHL